MTAIREATAVDGPALIAFFRDTPMRAGTEFVLDRGPDFGALLRLRGDWRTFIACRDGRVVGAVTALWHEGRDGDRLIRVGEVVDLRVAPELRGSPAAARLLTRAARAFEEAGADWVLCLIGDRNHEARRLVTGGAGLPPLAAVSRYASIHYPAWRVPGRRRRDGISIRRAVAEDAPVLARLARETATGRRFAPAALFPWPDPGGAHHAWIAEDRGGQPIGGFVAWDPMAVRRIRVQRYSPADQIFRAFMGLAGLFGAASPLPSRGEPLRIWASRWLGAVRRPGLVADLLVREAIRAAAAAGQHVLQLNIAERDPLFRLVPSLPRSFYWSTLYGRPLNEATAAPSGAAICYTDVALV